MIFQCKDDAIAQSWAVISGAADPDRARQAMTAVMERLVQQEERLILLFTPPFDKTSRDPGYIKGYLPGIRENGGQYTHAALWTIWAMAELGEGDQAEGQGGEQQQQLAHQRRGAQYAAGFAPGQAQAGNAEHGGKQGQREMFEAGGVGLRTGHDGISTMLRQTM